MADNTLSSVAERLRMMRSSQEPGDFDVRGFTSMTLKENVMRKLETLRTAFDVQV
jgi:hypothetical protein